jgi:hypothetical protein
MKHLRIAVAAAFALATLPAPWPIGTTAHAAHAFHFSNRLHAAHRHGTYGGYGAYYSPFYSGALVAVPPYAADASMTYAPPPAVVYVAEPPRALTCHRSRQTVTVPAEAGGTRQITVTRC